MALEERKGQLLLRSIGTCFVLLCTGIYMAMFAQRSMMNEQIHRNPVQLLDSEYGTSQSVEMCPRLHIDRAFREETKERMLREREAFLQVKKRIYVQHQHKCGGSTLCRFFKGSKLQVPTIRNCNGDSWVWPLVRGSREDLRILFQNSSYRVFFNERAFFRDEIPNDEFIFITSARDPKQRLMSSMLQTWKYLPVGTNGLVEDVASLLDDFAHNGFPQNATLDAPINLQVMHLAGESPEQHSFDWPALYTKALERLPLFTFTIPTENLTEGLEYISSFFSIDLNMPKGNLQWNFRDAGSHVEFLEKSDPWVLKKIEQENFFDYCLYQQVVELWSLQKAIVEETLGFS